jgi:hypothetical protein
VSLGIGGFGPARSRADAPLQHRNGDWVHATGATHVIAAFAFRTALGTVQLTVRVDGSRRVDLTQT